LWPTSEQVTIIINLCTTFILQIIPQLIKMVNKKNDNNDGPIFLLTTTNHINMLGKNA